MIWQGQAEQGLVPHQPSSVKIMLLLTSAVSYWGKNNSVTLTPIHPPEWEALCHTSHGVRGAEPQCSPGHPHTKAARAGPAAEGREA